MKDDRLEKEFEEYFKGVNISNDIIADAKASVKPKRSVMPKFVKFASIAASIVLVFSVTLTIIFRGNFNITSPDGGMSNSGYSPDAPGGADGFDHSGGSSGGGTVEAPGDEDPSGDNSASGTFNFYNDGDLVISFQSAYSIASLNSSLKFIEDFAYAYNTTVETCNVGYKDGKLTLVTAEVSILNGFSRDETTVFVEFTDRQLIYYELSDYYDGKVYNYYGAQYFLTKTTAQNGEPEYKLHISYNGVKYYFSVRSSDIKAYEKYLNIVIGK